MHLGSKRAADARPGLSGDLDSEGPCALAQGELGRASRLGASSGLGRPAGLGRASGLAPPGAGRARACQGLLAACQRGWRGQRACHRPCACQGACALASGLARRAGGGRSAQFDAIESRTMSKRWGTRLREHFQGWADAQAQICGFACARSHRRHRREKNEGAVMALHRDAPSIRCRVTQRLHLHRSDEYDSPGELVASNGST